ncbi:MAG: hypothetical protein BWX67_00616 [Thermotogae bacterium ADurb.Bin062]|nr:MAG: hypothetical protein BWX67_00616 [Thermotogota bacterium ADurb.Bin062]
MCSNLSFVFSVFSVRTLFFFSRTHAKLKFGVPRRSQMCSNLSFVPSMFSVRTPFFPLRNPYRAKVRRSQGFPKNRVK